MNNGLPSEAMEYTPLYKVMLVGQSGVGKTCLLMMYVKGTTGQTIPTISVEFCTKEIQISNGPLIKVQLWDTAGTERYQSIAMNFYRKAHGILLLFDVTSRLSFNACKTYLEDVRTNSAKDCLVYLVGNKIDLANKREVSKAEAELFANKENIIYVETSAIQNTGVNDAFQALLNDIYRNKKEDLSIPEPSNLKLKPIEKPAESSNCCL